jgi:SOS response regulatory protein OraA/RecX
MKRSLRRSKSRFHRPRKAVVKSPETALRVGLKALERRELSFAELRTRLERSGVAPEEAARVSASLRTAGYQSDERTASERARVLAARCLGDAAIIADLEGRGLSTTDIDAALADVPNEEARADTLATKLGRNPKLLQTLRRKGYSEETIYRFSSATVAEA